MNTWLLAELPRIVGTYGKRYIRRVDLPEGDGHPIVMYPGFTTGNKSTAPMSQALARVGHNTLPWNHERNCGLSDELFDKLVEQIDWLYDSHNGQAVSIVGHSLGGVIGRAVSNVRPEKIRRVVAIGSPINGIEQSLSRLRPTYDRLNGENSTEQHWNEYRDLLTRKPSVPCTSIFSKTDGVVRPGMSKLMHEPLATNIIVQGGHFSMMIDPDVVSVVANQLLRV